MSEGWTLDRLADSTLEVWPGQSPFHVKTRAFELGVGVLDRAGALFGAHLGVGPVLLIDDKNTRRVAAAQVESSLRAAGFQVHTLTLEDPRHPRLEADTQTVGRVQQALREVGGAVGVIAVGAGTLNDLAKLASFKEGLPYGVVATAASMNGYTSAIAAILDDGIKRTVPCGPPVAVLADLDVVAAAPTELTLSGLGDLLSKPVSSGDWRLSHLLMGEAFSPVPLEIVEAAFGRVRAEARGIGAGAPGSVGALLEALLLSGISMASAGSSAPASGGEHLISHYWDMTAPWRSREIGLHGAQVGVATLVSATLYRLLRERRLDEASALERGRALPSVEEYLRGLEVVPGPLQAGMAAEVRKKWPALPQLSTRLGRLSEQWGPFWADLSGFVEAPEVLREVLESAGAPTSCRQIGIPEWEMREAFLRARDVRARYTVLDLAWEMFGLEALLEPCLDRSGVLR